MLPFALVLAVGPGLTTPEPEPVPIVGGIVTDDCQWPATVLMSGCSGTLIHPEVVLYAAHCPNTNAIGFGVNGNDRQVATTFCLGSPDYPGMSGSDFKFCRLAQPVTDVPFVPMMMGCEADQIPIDTPVVVVGYGNTSDGGGGFGTKRWIDATIAGFPNGGTMIGLFYEDVKTGACNGDSGGSTYVQLEDGSWRLVGISSTVAGSCGGSSQHVPAWHAAQFIEDETGLDVTPCHDADGTWNPSDACTGFPLDPDDGSGKTWANGCGPGQVSGASMTCGPVFGDPPDATPPTVEIVTPAAGAYEGPMLTTSIEVTAADDWALRDVAITFDGEVQAQFEEPPFVVETVNFPEGTWELTATAHDWSGNEAEAVPVVLEVGQPAAETGDDDDDGAVDDTTGGEPPEGTSIGEPADADGSDGTGDGTGDEAGAAGDEGGCSCRSTSGGATWLVLVLLGRLRSRSPSRLIETA